MGKAERREHIHHWLPTVLGLVVTVAILVTGGLFLYLAFWPVKAFTFTTITTDQKVYTAGDTITYTVKGCKFTDLPFTVDIQFEGVDNTHYEYPIQSFAANVRAGCGIGVNNVQLPVRVNPGVYVLRDTVQTQVNALHTETSTGVSNCFIVTAASEATNA